MSLSRTSSPLIPLCVGAGAGAVLALVGSFLLTRACTPAPARAYVLAVRVRLLPRKLDTFLWLWAPLARLCRASEPRTLSYELCLAENAREADVEGGAEVLIYERYVDKEDLTTTHHASAAFKAFQTSLAEAAIVAERSRATWVETGLGYMSR